MARYFVDTDDGHLSLEDVDGHELPSIEFARKLALRAMSEMTAEALQGGHDRGVIKVQVRDAAGMELYRAELSIASEWVAVAQAA